MHLGVQVQDGRQHEQRSGQGEDDELDGRVQPPLPAPDADDEVHGDQHQFPKHVEREQVDGQKGSQHAGFQHQHGHGEFPTARLVQTHGLG